MVFNDLMKGFTQREEELYMKLEELNRDSVPLALDSDCPGISQTKQSKTSRRPAQSIVRIQNVTSSNNSCLNGLEGKVFRFKSISRRKVVCGYWVVTTKMPGGEEIRKYIKPANLIVSKSDPEFADLQQFTERPDIKIGDIVQYKSDFIIKHKQIENMFGIVHKKHKNGYWDIKIPLSVNSRRRLFKFGVVKNRNARHCRFRIKP